MAKILINLDDLLLSEILAKSNEKGVSLDKFIEDILNGTPTETKSALSEAITRAKQKNKNDEFVLKALFKAEEWESLAVNPKSLGRFFLREVESGQLKDLVKLINEGSYPANYKKIT